MSILNAFGNQGVDCKKIGIDKNLLDMMYEVAMYGIVRSHFQNALKVLEGMRAARPDSEVPDIGYGLLSFAMGDYGTALGMFEKNALGKNPKNDLVKAYVGLTYKSMKRNEEAEKVFKEVIERNGDQAAVALARASLEQMVESKA